MGQPGAAGGMMMDPNFYMYPGGKLKFLVPLLILLLGFNPYGQMNGFGMQMPQGGFPNAYSQHNSQHGAGGQQ